MKGYAALASILLMTNFNINGQHYDGLVEELVTQLPEELQGSLDENETIHQLLSGEIEAIDLNRADINELRTIPWVTSRQINSLQNYLEQNGPLVSIYELQAVPGWDLATIRLTAPLVKLNEISPYYDPRGLQEKLQQDGGIELLIRAKRRLELSQGYRFPDNRRFQGSPYYWLYRLRYREKGSVSFGINAEKDPGERVGWDPSIHLYGVDHLSMHMLIENKGRLKRLLLGDFKAHWDQGLVVSSGFNLGQPVVTGPRKIHRGLLPHSGNQEYGYFRGLGLELDIGNTIVSTFFSRRMLDARVQPTDTLNGMPRRVPSIIETGLHRTTTEIERKNQLQEHVLGIHIRKVWHRMSVGLSGVYRDLKFPLIPETTRYNKFWFSGKQNYNLSGSIEYTFQNFNFFSQFALSASGGWGGLAGVIACISDQVTLNLHLRKYTYDFHGVSPAAFGESSRNISEQGLYWGIRITPSRNWVAGFYTNLFKFPGPVFNIDAESHGITQLFRLQYMPNRKDYINFYWRRRSGLRNEDPTQLKLTHDLTTDTKHSIGLRAKWQNQENITYQARIQYTRHLRSGITTQGMIASNQLSYSLKFLRITASLAHFSTDNFENRQFIYERDLPLSLSIPFFEGTGIRWYSMIQLKVIRKVDFWLRIAQTNYGDREVVGSGNDAINGAKRTDLSFQIRYKM